MLYISSFDKIPPLDVPLSLENGKRGIQNGMGRGRGGGQCDYYSMRKTREREGEREGERAREIPYHWIASLSLSERRWQTGVPSFCWQRMLLRLLPTAVRLDG